mgnify:CR=1 FL=1
MNLKDKIRNPQVQQTILEVVFPIVGYLLWEWSLMIIIVFYLLDYIIGQIFFIRRLYFSMSFHKDLKYSIIFSSIFSFLLFLSGELLILNDSFTLIYAELDKSHYQELIKFAKEEVWLLFPAIGLMYFMTDKMFFYMPRRFLKVKAKNYALKNLIANIIILFLIAGGKFIFDTFQVPDLIVIIGIVITKLVFDVYIKKKKLNIQY